MKRRERERERDGMEQKERRSREEDGFVGQKKSIRDRSPLPKPPNSFSPNSRTGYVHESSGSWRVEGGVSRVGSAPTAAPTRLVFYPLTSRSLARKASTELEREGKKE